MNVVKIHYLYFKHIWIGRYEAASAVSSKAAYLKFFYFSSTTNVAADFSLLGLLIPTTAATLSSKVRAF